jgi:hypothetical protein
MSFFKNIFGKAEQPSRALTTAEQLLVGDIIVLTDSFALPDCLRQQQFRVSAVNSYEYEHNVDTEWVLTGNHGHELYLSLAIDDQTELKFSLKIKHQDIESLFDLTEFATVFDEPGQAYLHKQRDTTATSGWTDAAYQQAVFSRVGYFHRTDHRSTSLSEFEGKEAGEQFELYALYAQDEQKGIDIEVWQDGDTDVFLTLYRPLSDIVDMYPGS